MYGLQRKKLPQDGLPDIYGMVPARFGCDNRSISGTKSSVSGGTTMDKKILDVTCGMRGIWFNKEHPAAIYCDKR